MLKGGLIRLDFTKVRARDRLSCTLIDSTLYLNRLYPVPRTALPCTSEGVKYCENRVDLTDIKLISVNCC